MILSEYVLLNEDCNRPLPLSKTQKHFLTIITLINKPLSAETMEDIYLLENDSLHQYDNSYYQTQFKQLVMNEVSKCRNS